MVSLKNKLIILFTAVGLLSGFLGIVISILVATSNTKELSLQNQFLAMSSVKKELELFLDKVVFDLTDYAFSGVLSSYITNVEDEEGRNQLLTGLRNAQKTLSEKGFGEVMVILPGNKVFSVNGEERIVLDDGKVQEIISGKKKYVLIAPIDYHNKKFLAVLSGMYDFGENIIGILVGLYPLENIQNMISKTKIGKTGYLAVTYGTMVIAHPKSELVGKLDLLKEKGTELLGREISGKEKGSVDYNFQGKKNAVFEKIKDYNIALIGILPTSELFSTVNQIVLFGIIAGVFIIVISLLIAIFISRTITQRINYLSKLSNQVAEHDLTVQIEESALGKDEIAGLGRSFKLLLESFRQTLGEIIKIGAQVSSVSLLLDELVENSSAAAEQSREIVEKTSLEVQDIASATEEANSGMEEIASGAQNIAIYSGKLSQAAEIMNNNVQIVDSKMQEVEDSVQRIFGKVEDSKAAIIELTSLSDMIGEIVNTISSISEQTNLLALNAAIEAARAGESGRGFAVVADEIRKLAAESRESTRKIADILGRIGEKAKSVEKATNSVSELFETYVKIVHETRKSLDVLISKIDEISKMTTDLAATSQEQSGATQEVSAAIDRVTKSIVKVEQDIRDMAEQISKQANQVRDVKEYASELSQAVDELNDYVKLFKL